MSMRIILLIILGLMMVACKSKVAPTPVVSSTSTPIVQEIASPPVSKTPTPVKLPPSVTPNLDLKESGLQFDSEFTSISVTPSNPVNSYKSKNWTEEEWLESLVEMRIPIAKLISNWSPMDSNYHPQVLTQYLIILDRETLLRYPNMDSKTYSDIAWDMVYRESINLTDRMRVDRLASMLEKSLNSGEIALESITEDLLQRDFKVVTQLESRNLFGDSKSGVVLQIESSNPWLYLELEALVAVGKSNSGDFHVIAVVPYWHWNDRSELTIFMTDNNENQVAEITLVNDFWGSGFPGGCGSNLSLFEWQETFPEGQFENIATNVSDVAMSVASVDCERPWEFEDENVTGVPIIKATSRFYIPGVQDDCPRYEWWTLYEWNGQTYERVNDGVNPIEAGSSKCKIGWANLAGGLNDDAVVLVETALSDWSTEVDDIWGLASEDYFRFKLGTWYALRGETELAIETLESVRDNPTNPDFGEASELASLFLINYESQDVNVACDAVQEHIYEIAPHPVCCGYDSETMLATWGFANPEWGYFIFRNDICEQEPAASQPGKTVTPEAASWTLAKQEQAISQVEQTLFDDRDFIQARLDLLDLLDADFVKMENRGDVRSYLLYLLALTYELSGDEDTAVGLYWQLWTEYPNSSYALVIRHKLELIE